MWELWSCSTLNYCPLKMETKIYNLKCLEIIVIFLLIIGVYYTQPFRPLIIYIIGNIFFIIGIIIWVYKEKMTGGLDGTSPKI